MNEDVASTGVASTGVSSAPLNLMQAVEAAHIIQQGQELQKRLNAPELKPSLIEQFMATKGFSFGVQQKAEQRQRLIAEQQMLAHSLVQGNRGHLLPAIFTSLKPEESAALVKADMN